MNRLKPKAKARPTATRDGVPLTPIFPPWTITQETVELLTAWMRWHSKMQQKPTPPNPTQQGAISSGLQLQGYLMHQDIYLP